jgi:excisionase family DNA binding protein
MGRKLTTAELAALLSVSPDTVRGWAASGAIPVLRACHRGMMRFDEAEVMAALRRAGRHPPPNCRRPGDEPMAGAPPA